MGERDSEEWADEEGTVVGEGKEDGGIVRGEEGVEEGEGDLGREGGEWRGCGFGGHLFLWWCGMG